MEKTEKDTIAFSSNAVRLSPCQWLVTGMVLAVIIFVFPKIWAKIERFDTHENFRLSTELRDDYWLFSKWAQKAADQYPILFLGDSVIWGAYSGNDGTLPVYLNEQLGRAQFANLAMDGLHPVAMAGLLEYYGSAIRNKKVILHFNPLWLSSSRHDLSSEKEFPIHQPRLIPQWYPRIESYRESFDNRLGISIQRYLPYPNLIGHLRFINLEATGFGKWIVEHPYRCPFENLSLKIDAESNQITGDPNNWRVHNLVPRDFQWLGRDDSFQWKFFVKTVKILRSRDNEVLVMVGPFNPYMMTPASSLRYKKMYTDIISWLSTNQVDYYAVPDMDSDYYADASHPTEEGYKWISRQMLSDEKVLNWINK